MIGKVARIVADKGFGFIYSDGKDYFFHKSGCRFEYFELEGGEEVEFDPIDTPKGPRAENIQLVNE